MALPEPRLLVAIGMLAWASVSDLRTRRVPNLHWYPFVAAALAFLLTDIAHGATLQDLARPLLVASLVSAIVYGLFHLHLFGGADAKGLMVLAFLLPHPEPGSILGYPAAASVLFNASASVVVPLTLALVNLARGDVALPAMLLGLRMDLDGARLRHVWPLQHAADGGIRWRFWQRMGAGIEETYDGLARAGARRVWVTPKVPFMVPLLIGLLAYAAWGDLLVRAVLWLG